MDRKKELSKQMSFEHIKKNENFVLVIKVGTIKMLERISIVSRQVNEKSRSRLYQKTETKGGFHETNHEKHGYGYNDSKRLSYKRVARRTDSKPIKRSKTWKRKYIYDFRGLFKTLKRPRNYYAYILL